MIQNKKWIHMGQGKPYIMVVLRVLGGKDPVNKWQEIRGKQPTSVALEGLKIQKQQEQQGCGAQ